LELKTRPKELLGSFPLDIALPDLTHYHLIKGLFPAMSTGIEKMAGNQYLGQNVKISRKKISK
jgi:hypothetical protein